MVCNERSVNVSPPAVRLNELAPRRESHRANVSSSTRAGKIIWRIGSYADTGAHLLAHIIIFTHEWTDAIFHRTNVPLKWCPDGVLGKAITVTCKHVCRHAHNHSEHLVIISEGHKVMTVQCSASSDEDVGVQYSSRCYPETIRKKIFPVFQCRVFLHYSRKIIHKHCIHLSDPICIKTYRASMHRRERCGAECLSRNKSQKSD